MNLGTPGGSFSQGFAILTWVKVFQFSDIAIAKATREDYRKLNESKCFHPLIKAGIFPASFPVPSIYSSKLNFFKFKNSNMEDIRPTSKRALASTCQHTFRSK
jgi:hypothetical protein